MKKQKKLMAFFMSLVMMFLVLGTGNSLEGRSVQAEEVIATDTDADTDGDITTGEEVAETTELPVEEVVEEVIPQEVTFDNNAYVGENYQVTFTLDSYWDSGYNATITIANTGDSVIENWTMAFPLGQNISNIWNATIAEVHEDYFVIKNDGWNQDIAVGGSVSFGITCYEAFTEYPAYYTLLGNEVELADGDYSVAYEITVDWGFGYKAQITITNNKDAAIEDWRIKFNYGDNLITQIWDGVIISDKDGEYFIGCQPFNQNIAPGASVTFGFLVEPGTSDAEVRDIVVTEYVVGDNAENDESEVEEGEVTEKDYFLFVYTLINSETDELGLYMLSTVDCIKYEIYSSVDGDEYIMTDSISEDSYMYALSNDFSKTNIYVRGYFEENSYIESEIISVEYNDGDYLIKVHDSDGDGLDDTYEVIYTSTDPFLTDSDENGIFDSDEDLDVDGLSNIEEYEIGTLPYDIDSDNDDILDYDEVYVYFTNPMDEDTDDEGLLDGEDVALGFDPNLQDTDGNGILDSDEKSLQKYEYDIVDDEKKEILSVSIELECEGLLENNVYVQNMYNLDVMSSEVVGLVGVPVEIQVDSEFDTANIIFTYDDDMLGETSELNLCMMWYDEENNQYVLLEDSVVDIGSNTVTYETTHFSTYLLVDIQVWYDTWKQEESYSNFEEVEGYDIVILTEERYIWEAHNEFLVLREALYEFVDSLDKNDRVSLALVSGKYAGASKLRNDKTITKRCIGNIYSERDTLSHRGLRVAVDELNKSDIGKQKIIVYVSGGGGGIDEEAIQDANDSNIIVHCVSVGNGARGDLHVVSSRTEGNFYQTSQLKYLDVELKQVLEDIGRAPDTTDTDGDGIYDIYEVKGTKAINGKLVFSDPNLVDSDYDGINDYDELCGLPQKELMYLFGEPWYRTINCSIGNPQSADTDDDGIADSNDSMPEKAFMIEIVGLEHDEFLEITTGEDENDFTYGGAQGWWDGKNQTIKEYGCGAIALCNVELYLMLYNEDFYDESTYTRLTGDRLGYGYYMDYVNDRIEEVYKVDYLIGDGVRPEDMEAGMRKFIYDKCVKFVFGELSMPTDANYGQGDLLNGGCFVEWGNLPLKTTAKNRIIDMLCNNIPVVASYYNLIGGSVYEIFEYFKQIEMSNYVQENFGESLGVYVIENNQLEHYKDIYSHYFTITGVVKLYDAEIERYVEYYRISTWGKEMYIECEEWLKELSYLTTDYLYIDYYYD